MARIPRRSQPSGRRIGYARVSTDEQVTDSQLAALRAAGCDPIREEHGSGADRSRPVLARLLREIGPGDTLVVVRLDRLARSVAHLLDVIARLEEKGAHFRSLNDPIDTTTPQGVFSLQVLGAVAQLERALIAERTKAGMAAAKAHGRLAGNPGLRERRPDAVRAASRARTEAYTRRLIDGSHDWLPVVQRMRPDHGWDDVVRALEARGVTWTVERLRRAVRHLVSQHMAPPTLLGRARRRSADDRLMTLVAGIAMADPTLSLRQIGAQLERMRERTPRGGVRWSASSVKALLDRAGKLGLGLV